MKNEKKVNKYNLGENLITAQRIRDLIGDTPIGKVADDLSLSRQTISNIINGRYKPDIDNLGKFADYFGVSTDYILGRTDVKSSDTTIQDICAITNLDEDAVKVIAHIGSMCSTTFAEFVKEGHLLSILMVILSLESAGEDFLRCGEEASTILDANQFEEYRSKDLNAIRYRAFSTFERIMDKYDVRITKEDEINKTKQAIADIYKEQVKDNFQETLKKVQEYHRRKNNGTNRTEKE